MSRIRDLASILTASSSMATDTEVSAVSAQIPTNVAGKNFLINGAFDIWQRGTSLAGGNGIYTADRWSTFTDNEVRTVTRQTTGDTTNLPHIQYCARFQRANTNTGTGRLLFGQSLETINSIPLAGKTVTISLYARAGANYSSTSNVLGVRLYGGTGTDQHNFVGYTSQSTIINSNATLTTSWQRFSFTGTVGESVTEVATQIGYTPTGTAGAADYFEITGVQLEIGSVATSFSRAGGDIQGELAKCQRYYWRASTDVTLNGIPFVGFASANSTTVANAWVRFPVSMRSNGPTSIDAGNPRLYAGTTQYNPNTVTLYNATKDQAQLSVTVTAGGLTLNQAYVFGHDNGAGSYVAFNAEL